MSSARRTAIAVQGRRIEVAHLGSWISLRFGGRKCAGFDLGLLPPGAVAAAKPQVADGCAASAADGWVRSSWQVRRSAAAMRTFSRAGGRRVACEKTEERRLGEKRRDGCLSWGKEYTVDSALPLWAQTNAGPYILGPKRAPIGEIQKSRDCKADLWALLG